MTRFRYLETKLENKSGIDLIVKAFSLFKKSGLAGLDQGMVGFI